MRATFELREERFNSVEGACAGELVDDGVVSFVVMVKVGVVFSGVIEDLEGEVEILLTVDHGDKAFGVEALWPWFDWWSDCVV